MAKATRKGETLTPEINDRDHIQGSSTAAITLVEFGDFECPYSADAVDTIRVIERSFGPRLRFVFRHFPLDKHAHAFGAAEAAEAAGAQGKFWEMYEWLFAHHATLAASQIERSVASLALDRERFNRDLSGHVYRSRVEADRHSGGESGVSGTPTFFINGVRYDGEGNLDDVMAALRHSDQ